MMFTDAKTPIISVVTHLYSYFSLTVQQATSWRKMENKREELRRVVDENSGIDENK
jgi:hypothetical protein